MTDENDARYMTPTEAAEYAKVTRQAIYIAIRKGKLKAFRNKTNRMFISMENLDIYRSQRHAGDLRRSNGAHIFDLEKGVYSVHQIHKFFTIELERPFPMSRVYYLLRAGRLKAHRQGAAWVILRDDAVEALELERKWYGKRMRRRA